MTQYSQGRSVPPNKGALIEQALALADEYQAKWNAPDIAARAIKERLLRAGDFAAVVGEASMREGVDQRILLRNTSGPLSRIGLSLGSAEADSGFSFQGVSFGNTRLLLSISDLRSFVDFLRTPDRSTTTAQLGALAEHFRNCLETYLVRVEFDCLLEDIKDEAEQIYRKTVIASKANESKKMDHVLAKYEAIYAQRFARLIDLPESLCTLANNLLEINHWLGVRGVRSLNQLAGDARDGVLSLRYATLARTRILAEGNNYLGHFAERLESVTAHGVLRAWDRTLQIISLIADGSDRSLVVQSCDRLESLTGQLVQSIQVRLAEGSAELDVSKRFFLSAAAKDLLSVRIPEWRAKIAKIRSQRPPDRNSGN